MQPPVGTGGAKLLEGPVTFLCLFFVGSVYLINGMGLLGRVDPRSSAPLNLFIGVLLLAMTARLMLPQADPTAAPLEVVLSAAGYLLFSFTFLYVGVINYTGHSGNGLGWYCGWGAMVSAALGLAWLVEFGDMRSAALWAVWAVVFAAFFAIGILGQDRLTRPTGWFVVVAGATTCLLPGGLIAFGLWSRTPEWLVVAVEGATVGLFLLLAARAQNVAEPIAAPSASAA